MTSAVTEAHLRRGGILLALMSGLVLRWSLRTYATGDATYYLLPWYGFAHDLGLRALKTGFTNYSPAYTYLLLLATAFDGLARPLTLIKAITWGVELANSCLAYRIVRAADGGRSRAAIAFAATWLAPTVLVNGAVFGQIDSLWCSFILLAVFMFQNRRDGAPAFAAAFAVKAQGAFLGPFILGQIFRRTISWRSLAWVPAVYLLLAAPVVAAGRPLSEVLTIYLDQAGTFHKLSMNAANLWALLSGLVPYEAGVPAGLALAAVGGVLLARRIAATDLDRPEALLLAVAASLLLTPFLLPKMHDRYFYAFEVIALVLASLNPRHLTLALGAQVTGLIAYLAFGYLGASPSVRAAAVGNGLLLLLVLRDLRAFAEPAAARSVAAGPALPAVQQTSS